MHAGRASLGKARSRRATGPLSTAPGLNGAQTSASPGRTEGAGDHQPGRSLREETGNRSAAHRRSSEAHSGLLSPEGWAHIQAVFDLPPRQMEVIRHIFDGHQVAAIAWKMGVKDSTVTEHIRRIYTTLQVADRSQLILKVMSEYLRFLGHPPPD